MHAKRWEFRLAARWDQVLACFIADAVLFADFAEASLDAENVGVQWSLFHHSFIKLLRFLFGDFLKLCFEPLCQRAILFDKCTF